jgi:ribosomal silencing factor RsfS
MMDFWIYDHVCLAKGTSQSQVEAIYQYNIQEEAELEAGSDVNMEDAENEEDKGALIMSHLDLVLL